MEGSQKDIKELKRIIRRHAITLLILSISLLSLSIKYNNLEKQYATIKELLVETELNH